MRAAAGRVEPDRPSSFPCDAICKDRRAVRSPQPSEPEDPHHAGLSRIGQRPAFWIDPKEDLIVIFMVQFWMSGTFNFRGQLKSIVYPALT